MLAVATIKIGEKLGDIVCKLPAGAQILTGSALWMRRHVNDSYEVTLDLLIDTDLPPTEERVIVVVEKPVDCGDIGKHGRLIFINKHIDQNSGHAYFFFERVNAEM